MHRKERKGVFGILGGPGKGAPRPAPLPQVSGDKAWPIPPKSLNPTDQSLEPFLGYTPPISPCTASASPTRLLRHASQAHDPSIPCLPQRGPPNPLHPRFGTAHRSARPRPPSPLCGAARAASARAAASTPSHLVSATPIRHVGHAHFGRGRGGLASPSRWPLNGPHPLHGPRQPLGHARPAQQVSSRSRGGRDGHGLSHQAASARGRPAPFHLPARAPPTQVGRSRLLALGPAHSARLRWGCRSLRSSQPRRARFTSRLLAHRGAAKFLTFWRRRRALAPSGRRAVAAADPRGPPSRKP